MPPLLEAKGLTKRYGATIALESVDFQVYDGITGLLGHNGAGKSTAIKLFLGLIQPTAGSAEVMGKKAHESVEIRARLGYMPEHDCLPSNPTASEFLSHMAQVSGLPPASARIQAADILRHVGLAEERYRSLGSFSTGMKQRVKLAQALVHDPTMVLLDEATSGLDPGGREEMLDLIRRTGREFGISILLSSHLMGDIERTCDHIIVLDGGHIEKKGSVSRFTQETQNIIIEVDNNLDELVKILTHNDMKATVEGPLVVVELEREEQFDIIRDAVIEADASLRRLTPRRHGLADIFRGTEE
jgi:ABC-2 type transport system ATP-binding protein